MNLTVCVLLALAFLNVQSAALNQCKKELGQLKTCQVQNAALKKENAALKAKLKILQENCFDEDGNIINWKAEVAKKDKVILDLRAQIKTLTTSINSLKARVVRLIKQVNDCEKKSKETGKAKTKAKGK